MQFSSIVINGFGYSKFQAMLVSLPGGFINFSTIWAGALIPRFFPGTLAMSLPELLTKSVLRTGNESKYPTKG
jgi:ACS family allantoate permease-like MFS transporter